MSFQPLLSGFTTGNGRIKFVLVGCQQIDEEVCCATRAYTNNAVLCQAALYEVCLLYTSDAADE